MKADPGKLNQAARWTPFLPNGEDRGQVSAVAVDPEFSAPCRTNIITDNEGSCLRHAEDLSTGSARSDHPQRPAQDRIRAGGECPPGQVFRAFPRRRPRTPGCADAS